MIYFVHIAVTSNKYSIPSSSIYVWLVEKYLNFPKAIVFFFTCGICILSLQVKCYLQMSSLMEATELKEAMDVIESTNLKYFTKEMVAEFMALKGSFLAQTGKSEEANKCFSASVQLHDGLWKAWALWGDYLDQLFAKDRNLTLGLSALTCYLHACRNQSEGKCRKYLASIIYMLSYDDEKGTLAEVMSLIGYF